MDKFNLNVYVEQVNHEADCTNTEKWEENEEQALSNVIDPNTEFKVINFIFLDYWENIKLCKRHNFFKELNFGYNVKWSNMWEIFQCTILDKQNNFMHNKL